jgi:methionyl-tRNA synthetase
MSSFSITTAIDYVNGTPHLGHAYEKVLTDVVARYRRLRGDDVFFLTGTDEHGQKVQQSARALGTDPQSFADANAAKFRDLCRDLAISNDGFIRTTEPRHKAVVQRILQDLFDRGEIYKGTYTGFYSVRQEQYLKEKDRLPDGSWPSDYGEVVEVSEPNYFFKLSQHQDWLIDHLQQHPEFIVPRFRQKQVLEFLKEPLNDLSISRPVERLEWGIPLPFDEGFVTYVWFDALINYISAHGVDGSGTTSPYWPAHYHVIGKDILIPSHAVYWPIMLKVAGIELPKSLLVHGFWTIKGAKMSKSSGTVVDPLALAEQFGADAFRYFVIREMNVGQDSEFSAELFLSRYNNDLGNDLGNLLSRVLNMGARYVGGVLPEPSVDEAPEREVAAQARELIAAIPELYDGFQFHLALERTIGFARVLNRYAEQRQPWKLAKSEAAEDRQILETSLVTMAEGLRLLGVCLLPVMPTSAERLQTLTSGDAATAWNEASLSWNPAGLIGKTLGAKTILFPRQELETEEKAPGSQG